MALARVSCILSSEDGDERTILDDYVHTPEHVEDYVTQYSGIHPGDLDPTTSTRNLTTLKATYLKLRALVDAGVIFVGHGLSQDFRVCNIAVPRKQIIDTL
uniref:PAB-dependent poly(A)-specific ribonuclease subunit 2 n=1 Tax=Lygus hesperus TaxID=30085 RepID=A0A0A9WRG7_LYGHE